MERSRCQLAKLCSNTDSGTAALIGGAVVVDAHLYGLLGGLAVAPLAWRGASGRRGRDAA